MKIESLTPSSSSASALGGEVEFLSLLWELDHVLQRRSKRMHAELGVTAPQRLVLRIVGRLPGIPAGELSALLHLHPSTLSGILRRLERGGWLRRRSDPRDRRRTLLGLTERGRAVDADRSGTLEEIVHLLLESVPPADVAAARKVLAELTRQLADEPVVRDQRSRTRPR